MKFQSAYINVVAITMIFAAAAGALVTLGAVIMSIVSSAKSSVREKLGIDENRGKEVEADLSETFGETQDDTSASD